MRSLLVSLVACLLATAPAVALECPAARGLDTPATLETVARILPAGIDLDPPNAAPSAIDELAKAGIPDDLIVDNLIASFCASIAADPSIPDALKTQRVQDFATRIEPLVYSDED